MCPTIEGCKNYNSSTCACQGCDHGMQPDSGGQKCQPCTPIPNCRPDAIDSTFGMCICKDCEINHVVSVDRTTCMPIVQCNEDDPSESTGEVCDNNGIEGRCTSFGRCGRREMK